MNTLSEKISNGKLALTLASSNEPYAPKATLPFSLKSDTIIAVGAGIILFGVALKIIEEI